MPPKRISVTLSERTHAIIESKSENFDGNISGTIERLVSRYTDLLRREASNLDKMFSDGEKGLILDALNGTGFFDSFGIYMVAAEIADAISMDGLDKKWSVDGNELMAKLESLNNGQLHALVDSVQTWWNATTKQEMKYGQLFNV